MEPSFIGWVDTVLPLVAAHLIVPPLSYFSTLGWVMERNSSGWFRDLHRFHDTMRWTEDSVRSLLVREGDFSRPANLLTYNFVHNSYDHMSDNLLGLLLASYDVYEELGPEGFYMLFFAGGIFAALPTTMKVHQEKGLVRDVGKLIGSLRDIIPDALHGGKVDSTVNKLSHAGERATRWGLTYALSDRIILGSSGSVYTIAGANLARLAFDVVDIFNAFRSGHGGDISARRRRAARLRSIVFQLPFYVSTATDIWRQAISIYDVSLSPLNITAASAAIHGDIAVAGGGLTKAASETAREASDAIQKVQNLFLVAVAGHLQGAAFGFTVMSVVMYHKMRRR